jgi:hypothetical protein
MKKYKFENEEQMILWLNNYNYLCKAYNYFIPQQQISWKFLTITIIFNP